MAFSILHSRGRKSLDLLANDTETRDNWVTGLEMLIVDSVGKPYTKITDKYDNNPNQICFSSFFTQTVVKMFD